MQTGTFSGPYMTTLNDAEQAARDGLDEIYKRLRKKYTIVLIVHGYIVDSGYFATITYTVK